MERTTRLSWMLFAALAATSCGGPDSGDGGDADADADADVDADTDSDVDGGRVSASIASPDVDCGQEVALDVTADGFTLEEPTGQANAADHGHYAVYLDDASGEDSLLVGHEATAAVTLPIAVDSGAHALRVMLVENDGTPLDPPEVDTVDLDVSETPCVTASVDPTTIGAGANATVHVEVGQFVLEEAVGQPNQEGHGHYHVYLDGASGGDYLASDQIPDVVIRIPNGTSAGPHTLRVSVGQNNHTPVQPAVETILPITVE